MTCVALPYAVARRCLAARPEPAAQGRRSLQVRSAKVAPLDRQHVNQRSFSAAAPAAISVEAILALSHPVAMPRARPPSPSFTDQSNADLHDGVIVLV